MAIELDIAPCPGCGCGSGEAFEDLKPKIETNPTTAWVVCPFCGLRGPSGINVETPAGRPAHRVGDERRAILNWNRLPRDFQWESNHAE